MEIYLTVGEPKFFRLSSHFRSFPAISGPVVDSREGLGWDCSMLGCGLKDWEGASVRGRFTQRAQRGRRGRRDYDLNTEIAENTEKK